jgi:hypothetical protein
VNYLLRSVVCAVLEVSIRTLTRLQGHLEQDARCLTEDAQFTERALTLVKTAPACESEAAREVRDQRRYS